MPASMVKTKRDEKLWTQAKDRAAAEGHEGDWPYVVGIFQRMKRGTAKGAHVSNGWLLLPTAEGIRLWGLSKGAHKYIKRVPIQGKTTKTGKPRYRYYYNVAALGHEHAAGDQLNTKEGGRLDVVHVADGKVHVDDEHGNRHVIDAHELHSRMFGAHVEAAERLATKTAADWAKARGETKGTPGEALHAALTAAGMSHDAASSLARFVEARPGWTDAARRAMADAVAHSGRKPSVVAENLRHVASAAENLRTARNAKKVTPAHVAEAVEKRLPRGNDSKASKDGDTFPAAWHDLRDRLGKANARAEGLITALEHVGPEHTGLADKAKAAVADAAHHEAKTMAHAFPALRNDPELAHADELAARLTAVLAKSKAPTTTGATTTVYIANKDGAPEPRQARYRVMEADDVHASHLPGESFHTNKAYPEGVQERLYHSDKAEQEKVRANATSFRPDIVHNTNPDAVNGPPLITEDGVVLGGNSRTMSMQLVHGTGKSGALKDHLAANAYQFGLTKEAVEGMKHPILVRELVGVDSKSTPKGELKDLVRRANESFTQGMDPRAMQVALSGRVDDNMLEKLGKMDPEETLSEFLSKPASRDFVRSMQHAGIIDRRNRSQYLRDDGSLNQDGKQFVERLLVGKMIPDADLLGDVSPQHMAALSRAAPAILAARTNGDTHDLTKDLAVALRTQRDMDVRGHKTLAEHFSQNEMDLATGKVASKPIEGNDRAILLHKILAEHGKSPAVVAKMFRTYAKSASKEHDSQAGMFGSAPSSLSTLRASVEAHKPKKEESAATGDLFGKGATVYTGPKGGKYSDPEHKHHWVPTKDGAQADWVGAESAEKRAARKVRVHSAMEAWSSSAARMKANPGDRAAYQKHHDALHELAGALNLQTKDGERLAEAAAKWLKAQGHKVPTRRSGHSTGAKATQQSLFDRGDNSVTKGATMLGSLSAAFASLCKGPEGHTPPEPVRAAARRGLALREKYGKGGLTTQEAGAQGIGSGVARARDLAAGSAVSTKTLKRMVSFFARHRANKAGGEDDAGHIAWLLWGGDPGEAWAKRELAGMEKGAHKYVRREPKAGGGWRYVYPSPSHLDSSGTAKQRERHHGEMAKHHEEMAAEHSRAAKFYGDIGKDTKARSHTRAAVEHNTAAAAHWSAFHSRRDRSPTASEDANRASDVAHGETEKAPALAKGATGNAPTYEAPPGAMRRVVVSGITCHVERMPGEVRHGRIIENGYGEIPGTLDCDGEPMDCYIGPNALAGLVYVIDQLDEDGDLDEHKVMLGFDSAEDAALAYASCLPRSRMGGMCSVLAGDFIMWLTRNPELDDEPFWAIAEGSNLRVGRFGAEYQPDAGRALIPASQQNPG